MSNTFRQLQTNSFLLYVALYLARPHGLVINCPRDVVGTNLQIRNYLFSSINAEICTIWAYRLTLKSARVDDDSGNLNRICGIYIYMLIYDL